MALSWVDGMVVGLILQATPNWSRKTGTPHYPRQMSAYYGYASPAQALPLIGTDTRRRESCILARVLPARLCAHWLRFNSRGRAVR